MNNMVPTDTESHSYNEISTHINVTQNSDLSENIPNISEQFYNDNNDNDNDNDNEKQDPNELEKYIDRNGK